MVTLNVSYNPVSKIANVSEGTSLASGFTSIGSFQHPDATYPDSYVIYHGVRELLYHVTPGNPPVKGAKFPNNVTDMASVSIVTVAVPALTGITATPSTLALSVATDKTNGKTVAFTPAPSGAVLGNLVIKTAPASATATATIANNVLTVKPVAVGNTTVVVSNGTKDVTVTVNVSA